MAIRSKNIIFNFCIVLNFLLLFLLLFGKGMKVPLFLQVIGRMHPLVLHFPIVLLLLAIVFELLVPKMHNKDLEEASDWLLLLSALIAVIAALMGLFLSYEDGYDIDAIAYHKWTGVFVAFFSIMWFAFRAKIRNNRLILFTSGFLSLAGIILAGHKGATITHGENFLLEPITKKKKSSSVLIDDALVYTDLIQPILQEKCIGCHNTSKAKGGLIMGTKEALLKGGKHGKLWDTTVTGFGLMLKRIHLSTEDKEHMPPIGKPQLTEEEMKALYYWIKDGADFSKKVVDLAKTDSLRIIATAFFKPQENDTYDFTAADENVVKKLNTDYRVVQPLALNSPALAVEFFGASFFKPAQIQELDKVKNNIVAINLSKMPLKDSDIKELAAFKNLRKLNISFSKITGAALVDIAKLTDLRQLSLSGTKVNATDLDALKGMKKLSSVYVWNTNIKEGDIAALKNKFPNTLFETGFRGDTIVAQLSTPLIETDEEIFKNNMHVTLKYFIKKASLRYTLDGTDPDSLRSSLYTNDINIDRTTVLKVKAFLLGWQSSTIAVKNFYKSGFLPDSVQLILKPDPTYTGAGDKMLFDEKKGSLNFRDGRWLGYKENDMQAYLFLNNPITLSSITFSTLVDIGSYIMPPYELEVWGGTNRSNLKLLKKIKPTQPTKSVASYMMGYDCSFAPHTVSMLKLVAKPVTKLPAWHPGKGERGWVFIDEVFLN